MVSRSAPVPGRLSLRLIALFAVFSVAPLVLGFLFALYAGHRGWLSVAPSARSWLFAFALLLTVGGLVAGGLLWSYLRTRLVLPLRRLSESVERLAEGDFGRRLTITSDDDLALAADGFNKLAERLGDMFGDVEQQLGQRTREVGRAMGELHLLKKLNDAVIHNIPSGIAILGDGGRLLYFNSAFEATWRLPASRLGEGLQLLAGDGPLGEIDWGTQVAGVVTEDHPRRRVVVETGTWPHRRVIEYSLFPLPFAQLDAPLRVVGEEFCLALISPPNCAADCVNCFARSGAWQGRHVLLLVDDITDQHHLEAQLIQSEKLAALGQLSAGIAHEIRNPLSAIYGAAFYIGDVLTDEEPDLTDIEEYVRLIQRNVDRAQRIVTDILNFARPSDAEGGVAELADLAAQTLAILDKAMVDQGISLHAELRQGMRVSCRPETVKQALLNLVVNGMQAMPEGGTLTVRTALVENQPVLMVSDTGCGIPPENLHHVFNPFFTTKPAGQGTGLGLSIARRAIENDKGRLEVESQVGCGTTFRVYLPQAPAEPVEAAATTRVAER